jgi:SAM-dependent MidA family methyltransferase
LAFLYEIIRREIATSGPLRFDRFMELALYHPEFGYYRSARDPFGIDGDFFTASQLQPLFGKLVRSQARTLAPESTFIEFGPGRGEMAALFDCYIGIGPSDRVPQDLDGFVFANEFLDALPVRAGLLKNGELRELLVSSNGETLSWETGPHLSPEDEEYVRRYWPHLQEGSRFEFGSAATGWIERITSAGANVIWIIDYGYRAQETGRFTQGTLISYRRHQPEHNVLMNAGGQDITAHVAFDPIIDRATDRGFEVMSFELLAPAMLGIVKGEPGLIESFKDRQQLKTLVAGMGETFRSLLLRRRSHK